MISFIIPIHNEGKNVEIFINAMQTVLQTLGETTEVLLMENGSTDGWEKKKTVPEGFFLYHYRRPDKGRMLRKGIAKARGEIICFMDADMQDDPHDIPQFLAKIREGYEFVNGWRKNRKDHGWFTKTSQFGNAFILKLFLGSSFHDINCGFKMFQKYCIKDIAMYGDNFRFLPALVEKMRFKVCEVEVTHQPRTIGVSKFGKFKGFAIITDVLTAYFIFRFAQKPLHFFGVIGAPLFMLGTVLTSALAIERVFFGVFLKDRPLLLGGILLMIVGLQIILTGIMGELIVYTSKKMKA